MNKLDELIKKLCPSGVKYMPLGNTCDSLKKGTLKTNELIQNGKYPVINSGREFYGYYDSFNNNGNAFILAARGEYAGFVNYIDKNFWAGGLCYPYRSSNENVLMTKFIYYYLKSKEKYIMETLVARGSIPAINKSDIDKIMLPVPPLEVQCEIVHVLDDFTLLSAELSAELKARKKQYEYYKDKLFDFDDSIKVPLADICSMERGGNFQKKDFTEYGVPAIHYGKIYTYYGLYTDKTLNFINEVVAKKQKFAKNNDIVMAVTSENVEDVCKCVVWEGQEPVTVSGHSVIIRHNQNARFLAYYFTSSHFQKQKEKYCIGTKVIEMKPDNLAKILVPIPSIEEQNRIVRILDNFYSITNDISDGLPAEIEARQKQYEYYRDKLLAFKEIVNEG